MDTTVSHMVYKQIYRLTFLWNSLSRISNKKLQNTWGMNLSFFCDQEILHACKDFLGRQPVLRVEGFSQEGHHGRAPRNLGLEGCQPGWSMGKFVTYN